MPPRPAPRPSPTHFLCIPLVTPASRPQLSKSLAAFKADVTSPDSFAIPADAVRPLGTLHLTLGVMSIPKNEGVDKAVEVLKSLKPREVLSSVKFPSPTSNIAGQSTTSTAAEQSTGTPSSLVLTLRGLHSIQAASQASVLYAPPTDPQGILQAFCERIRAVFQEAHLIAEEDRPLLLHATIVNTIYVKAGRGPQGKRKSKLTIDAEQILNRYDDYLWMENVPVNKIALCRMGAKKIDGEDDEAYEVEAEIEF